MKLYFEQTNSLLYLIPALILAGLLVFITYRSKTQKEFYAKSQIRILASLRFVSFFLLIVLLLAPAIQWYQYHRIKPIIVFATDNSESLKNYTELSEGLINKAKEELGDFNVEYWTFGEKAKQSEKNNYSELRSDYSNLFQTVNSTYLPESVSSMVLVGDGIFNTGTDPTFTSQQFQYPVYTVGVGDSTSQVDAAILKVVTNQTTFLNDYFPVEINLSYQNLSGKDSKLSIWQGSEKVFERNLAAKGNDFFHQEFVRLKAEKSGIINYRIQLESFKDEKNTENNQYEFSIRVLDQKQKILLIGNGSHPDLASIIRVLEPQRNYSYKLFTSGESNLDLSDYDLVIAYQLPNNSNAKSLLLQEISQLKLPVLWIVGLKSSIPYLNKQQTGFTFDNNQQFELASAFVNPQFNVFQLDDFWPNQIETWPPLHVPFADIQLSGDWQTLLKQRIQTVNLERPLISLGSTDGVKNALIAGEGIWGWRMNDYLQNGSFDVFDGLMLKLINYLILKPNQDNFTVYFQPKNAEDQEVTFEAELLNASLEPVTDPDVSIHIISDSGTSYDYVFDKSVDHYDLNTGNLPVGSYSFEASAQLGTRSFKENGTFRIDKLQLEQADLQANFNLLYKIATNTGGQFVSYDHFSEIIQQIKRDSVSRENKIKQLIFKEFITLKWLALVIILLFSLEWFLRKFWGSY
ncbi:hypothetical protein [Mangrovibacterium lignilyticum]|uniref:hypothetical protein n=1 Tax=Mangrovibacterium lignilyticum TaxID=2668052 RepID=UPI0013D3DB89|nr:hypothetical protein [Mangrovibacterium lignilyticum]